MSGARLFFQSLPREIRDKIYTFSTRRHNAIITTRCRCRISRQVVGGRCYCLLSRSDYGLLRTNKQFYHEALSVLYGQELRFYDPDELLEFLRRVGSPGRSHIRFVSIYFSRNSKHSLRNSALLLRDASQRLRQLYISCNTRHSLDFRSWPAGYINQVAIQVMTDIQPLLESISTCRSANTAVATIRLDSFSMSAFSLLRVVAREDREMLLQIAVEREAAVKESLRRHLARRRSPRLMRS